MCCFGVCNTHVAAFTLRPRVCVVDYVSLLVVLSGLVINGAYASYTSYPYVLFVETNPVWLQTMSATQGVTITATISLTSGPTGVVLQYTDQNNYIYVMFDATARVTRYGTVYNGVFPRSVCHVSCRCRCRLPLSPAAALKGNSPVPLVSQLDDVVPVVLVVLVHSIHERVSGVHHRTRADVLVGRVTAARRQCRPHQQGRSDTVQLRRHHHV